MSMPDYNFRKSQFGSSPPLPDDHNCLEMARAFHTSREDLGRGRTLVKMQVECATCGKRKILDTEEILS